MLRKKLKLSSPEDSEKKAEIIEESLCLSNKYFNNQNSEDIPTILLKYAVALNDKLRKLSFSKPVEYVYNPVEYAFDMHASFIKKFCNDEKKILLLGMNPGPWGMAQTGVPFGEIKMVKEWYQIQAKINKPAIECPERQITGLNCHRSEVSGKRLYEFFKKISDTPENLFQNTYLYNYCPLALMKRGGTNVTPSSLKGPVRKELEEYCNDTLIQVLSLLGTEIIIALGVYVKGQAEGILKSHNVDNIEVIYMPHPSPIVPGNENWGEKAQKVLEENNLLKYFTPKCRNDRFSGQTVFNVSAMLNPVTIVKGGYCTDKAMALLRDHYKGTHPSASSSKLKIKGIDKKSV